MEKRIAARGLGSVAQEFLRRRVVEAVCGGMKQTVAAKTFGVSLRAVSKWMKLMREGGVTALKLKRRGRNPGWGRLNKKQATGIRKLIIDRMPDQMKLPFYLWTREAVPAWRRWEVSSGGSWASA
jgi:transposase